MKAGNWPLVSEVLLALSTDFMKLTSTPLDSKDFTPSPPYHDEGPLISDTSL